MTKPNAGKDVKKLSHLYNARENVKWHIHSGKLFGGF